jgi:hypothetical protein
MRGRQVKVKAKVKVEVFVIPEVVIGNPGAVLNRVCL